MKDPKAFWRYTNSKTNKRSTLGGMTKPDGQITQDDNEKAQILNNFFSSVFTQETLDHISQLELKYTGIPLCNITITESLVRKKLSKLKITKSAGPDGLHPRVLRELADSICPSLTAIYNQSISEHQVPTPWKEGVITPIHKKGNKTLAENYRPISLTSIYGRILESIIRDSIVSHMMANNLFCDAQHGFVQGRSCMTQLIVCMEKWMELLDSGHNIDILYTSTSIRPSTLSPTRDY